MRLNKKFIAVIATVLAAVILIIVLCCCIPSRRGKVDFSATFYYVCYDAPTDSQSASSMSSAVHSYGGAGYIIEYEGEYFVTVSCYYNDKDAQSVCRTLNLKGMECSVFEVKAGDYKLKGGAKKNAEEYAGVLNTLLELSRVCYGLANSLDDGSCGQSGAKSVLEDVRTGLNSLARQNAANCFSSELKSLCAECDDVSYGYVFSYDVRRLQIAITDVIVNVKLY